MPIPEDVTERIARAIATIRRACADANLAFVAVVEPRDHPTGVMIATDEDDQTERTVREARELLERAAERLRHSHYAVVTTDIEVLGPGEVPECGVVHVRNFAPTLVCTRPRGHGGTHWAVSDGELHDWGTP